MFPDSTKTVSRVSGLWDWFFFFFFFFFGPYLAACGILVPPTRDWTCAPAVEAGSLNHWTAREIPKGLIYWPYPCLSHSKHPMHPCSSPGHSIRCSTVPLQDTVQYCMWHLTGAPTCPFYVPSYLHRHQPHMTNMIYTSSQWAQSPWSWASWSSHWGGIPPYFTIPDEAVGVHCECSALGPPHIVILHMCASLSLQCICLSAAHWESFLFTPMYLSLPETTLTHHWTEPLIHVSFCPLTSKVCGIHPHYIVLPVPSLGLG